MAVEPGIQLNKEEVFKRISEEEIFEKYLQIQVDESVSYSNPLRVDNHAGCRFYRNKNGRLYFKDFSKGYHWDCFGVVQFIYNCDYLDSIRYIINDFKLNVTPELYEYAPQEIVRSRIKIQITTRTWDNTDIRYWNQYHLDLQDLSEGSVYACKAVWINGEEFRCKPNDPCYAYYFGNGLYKLYFPFRAENRFFQNIHSDDNFLQGYNLLKRNTSLLIITKSYKDVLCFRKLGVEAVAPISETQIITREHYVEFDKDFPYMAVIGDPDNRGRIFMLSHNTKYSIPYLIFPPSWGKDLSDCIKHKGYDFIKEELTKYKHEQGF